MRLDPPTMSLTHLNILTTWLELWRGNLAAAERSVVPLRSLIVDVQPMPQSVVGAIRVDAELAMFSQQPERAWSHLQCFLDHANLYDPVRSAAALAVGAAGATALHRRSGGHATVRGAAVVGPGRRGRAACHPAARGLDAADRRRARGRTGGVGAGSSPPCPGNAAAPVHLAPYAQLRWARHLAEARSRQTARASSATQAFVRADELWAWPAYGPTGPARGADRGIGLGGRRLRPTRRTDQSRNRGAQAGGGWPLQRRGRPRALHQHQDRQCPRVQHLGQAGRWRSR